MKITPNELFELNKWAEYCDLTGINVHAIQEGLMEHDEPLDITPEQFLKLMNKDAPDMYEALKEAKLQIEYLHDKFAVTGSGNSVLSKIELALAKNSTGQLTTGICKGIKDG